MSDGGPVVTNSGPIIALTTVGQLDVLGTLYGSVLVPGVVLREVTEVGVQIVARPWREDVALAVAQHLETALGGWQCPPL
jgi:predicted nucleic acid-binding protein